MQVIYKWFTVLIFLACNGIVDAQQTDIRFPIIPYPKSLRATDGVFLISPATRLMLPPHGLFAAEAKILDQFFINSFGVALKQGAKPGKTTIRLTYDASIAADEGYKLEINPAVLAISARTPAGMFMAIQTIRQLLPASVEYASGKPLKNLVLPALHIDDKPAFAWRGMHLDVARHFFSIAYLRKFIDVLALYKFNKFHLHLTDDEGWRIEIKKYPKLTANGAWRLFNPIDSACIKRSADNPDMAIDPQHIIHKDGKILYGGFYTQAEMRALVAYAAARHIDIIPEIDMPGHMMAAINQTPNLVCGMPVGFGKEFSTPVCPCEPGTFQFAEDVFTEIMDVFPSKYIHIGGDEVDRSRWAQSEECKQMMQRQGLKNTAELQSFFINHMEAFFNAKGRKLIGWDEVLEGGISKSAIIMYWRTWVPAVPLNAAKNGNMVVMSPGSPLYFDAIPDKNSVPMVYQFNPIPKGLSAEQAKYIMGAQANIWTEYIPSENRADYMYMPRMTALAEVLWTNHPNYPSYQNRLGQHYARLDALGVHYRLPDLSGFLESNVFTDCDSICITKPLRNLIARYTLDGSLPDTSVRTILILIKFYC